MSTRLYASCGMLAQTPFHGPTPRHGPLRSGSDSDWGLGRMTGLMSFISVWGYPWMPTPCQELCEAPGLPASMCQWQQEATFLKRRWKEPPVGSQKMWLWRRSLSCQPGHLDQLLHFPDSLNALLKGEDDPYPCLPGDSNKDQTMYVPAEGFDSSEILLLRWGDSGSKGHWSTPPLLMWTAC